MMYEKGNIPYNRELAGKSALITGGSSGIGIAVALLFAQSGARVALLARGEKRLQNATAEIEAIAGKDAVLMIPCDVTDEQAVIAAFEMTEKSFDGLDIVVSNAGSAETAAIDQTSLGLWQRMMDVHCTGYFLVAREAVRIFKRLGRGGSIVFVSSDNAVKPSKDFLAYNVAKAAELHMARCIAEECGQYGIRVNSVLPGAVFGRSALWTPEYRANRASAHGFNPEMLEEEYKKNSALHVIIMPEEVAEAVLFLASERSNKITGAALSIDGGGKSGYVR